MDTFACIDPDGWAKCVKNNSDPYGHATVSFAARWANLMESAIASGSTLEACADELLHVADTEGITGFMYGCAVNILAKVWEHGEALRQWHNVKTQLGTEGEKANAKPGAVLNPALLCVGT